MKIKLSLFCLLLGLQSLVYADSDNSGLLSGLWTYEEISHGGDAKLPNKGLFLFHKGRFFQQTIDDDMGQGHAGRYTVSGDYVSFDLETGVLVSENTDPVLSVRQGAENQAKIKYKDGLLTLTFEENTVQTLRKLAAAENTEIYPLIDGYLVLADNNFIYISLNAEDFVAGSGSFVKEGEEYLLQANPWISVSGKRVSYSYNENINLNLDQKIFRFSDGCKRELTITEGKQ